MGNFGGKGQTDNSDQFDYDDFPIVPAMNFRHVIAPVPTIPKSGGVGGVPSPSKTAPPSLRSSLPTTTHQLPPRSLTASPPTSSPSTSSTTSSSSSTSSSSKHPRSVTPNSPLTSSTTSSPPDTSPNNKTTTASTTTTPSTTTTTPATKSNVTNQKNNLNHLLHNVNNNNTNNSSALAQLSTSAPAPFNDRAMMFSPPRSPIRGGKTKKMRKPSPPDGLRDDRDEYPDGYHDEQEGEDEYEELAVPTMFTWSGGGSNVYVIGTWDNWKTRIPLNKSTSDFSAITDLPPGIHHYKFIVDGRWKHAPEQPVVSTAQGDITNILEIQALISDYDHIDPTLTNSQASGAPHEYSYSSSSSAAAAASIYAADSRSASPALPALSNSPPGEYGQFLSLDQYNAYMNSKDHHADSGLDSSDPTQTQTVSRSALTAFFSSSSSTSSSSSSSSNSSSNNTPTSSASHTPNISPSASIESSLPPTIHSTPPPAINPATFFDYSKPPPTLPVQLQKCLLNNAQLEEEPTMLPLPHHVMLNHLYLMRRDNRATTEQDMVILGTTTRYNKKFLTTVFYKPL